MTPEEKKLRRTLLKDVSFELKRAPAVNSWRHAGGFLFREHLGWFIELTCEAHPDREITTARLYVKPMGLDPVFWEMVHLPENTKQPLSFRARGAWTCSTPDVAELVFEDTGLDAAKIVNGAFRWANEEVAVRHCDWTISSFVERIEGHPRQAEAFSWLPALIAGLVLAGRTDIAREHCLAARRAGAPGGFTAGGVTFPDMALGWIDRSATAH